MARSRHIYDYPLYYEIGFCCNDVRREVDFLLRCYQRHRGGCSPASVLDNGCGTGVYLEEFARRGLDVCGYDLRAAMVNYARKRLSGIADHAELLQADMREFKVANAYDMAICMNGSFQYLLTPEDMVQHLRAVYRAMREGGLYLVGLPAPEELMSNPPGSIRSGWTRERDGIEVQVDWTYRQHPIDWRAQTFSGLAKIRVCDRSKTLSLELPYRYRVFFPQELEALACLSGCFRVMSVYGDFHLGRVYGRMQSPKLMLVLLQKTMS